MRREARGAILGLVAILLLRLSLTDDYLLYVKSAMRPFLIISGVLLAGLAAIDVLGLRPGSDEDDSHAGQERDGHPHAGHAGGADDDILVAPEGHADHGRGLLPWLLVAPFVLVFAVGPQPLGAFLAERNSNAQREQPVAASTSQQGSTGAFAYPDLPDPVNGAVEIDIAEFANRVVYDTARQMDGVLVRMDGFVAADKKGDGSTFLLTRFQLSCCAADGVPVSVRVRGLDQIPPTDTWLSVEGFWIPHTTENVPEIDDFEAESVQQIPAPADPYL